MSDGLTINIDLRVFEQDMKQLAGPVADKVGMTAMTAGGQVLLEALQEVAPERPDLPSGTALPVGALAADLQTRSSKQADGTIVNRTGPGKATRHVAGWVEYGHEQAGFARSEKRLIGGHLEGKFVPAHPWIRIAYETTIDEAVSVVGFVLQEEIASQFAKLGYRAA